MRILVTGTRGQVARALVELGPVHDAVVLPVGRPEFDFLFEDSVAGTITNQAPDLIVNAAAYTAVDKAEAEPELAHRVNGRGAGLVGQAAAVLGVPVIQLSTDYVFDGKAGRPYFETDAVRPVSIYGASKLAGEAEIAARTRDHVILRTSWVYSPFGQNFVKTMCRLARSKRQVMVVSDQIGTPTSAIDIADAILVVARKLLEDPSERLRGVFHITSSGEATWAEFATDVFAHCSRLGIATAEVIPISTEQYPTAAQRPMDSRLDCSKLLSRYGFALPYWRESLASSMPRIVERLDV